MMESGELVVRYRARRTYSRRTTEATCEFTPLLLQAAQNKGISNIWAWLSLQQTESWLSACTNTPLSPGQTVKRRKKTCLYFKTVLLLIKRSGCDQFKRFPDCSGRSKVKSLLRGRRQYHPAVMHQWGVDVNALSQASIPVSPQEYRREKRTKAVIRFWFHPAGTHSSSGIVLKVRRSKLAKTTKRPEEDKTVR